MTFTEALIAAGYVYDEENYDGCFVKQDADNFIHCYQQGEDVNEWNYVKMSEDFDVISEVTFDPDSNFIVWWLPFLIHTQTPTILWTAKNF